MKTHTSLCPNSKSACPTHACAPRARRLNKANGLIMDLILAAAVLMPQWTLFAAGPLPVDLGEAGHFTLLAYATITYPGAGTVVGDIGLHPGGGASILVPAPNVTGIVYARDAGYTLGAAVIDDGLLNTAKLNLGTAYDYAAGLPAGVGPNLNPGTVPGHIGGMNLAPGIYTFDTGTDAYVDVADLTLTGGPDDVWVFQMGRALIVEPGVNRSVILAGGAQAKNVFWQVGSSATLGTYSVFKGTIMAYASVILDEGSQLEGRALALNEQVVFGGLSANMPMDAIVTNLTLTIISEHGVGDRPAGLPPAGLVYTNDYGATLTNSITGVVPFGVGTQYVNVGWVMTGNEPVAGTNNTSVINSLTNDAVLTWLWSTNYLLGASAVGNGMVTGDTNGFYVAGSTVVVTATPSLGYQFAGWTGDVGGADTNDAVLTLTMDQARTVVAHFSAAFIDVTGLIDWNVNWVFNPRTGYFTGALTISNRVDSEKSLLAPFWFEVESTEWHWLRYPTGIDTNTGFAYVDISTAVTNQLPGIGDGDLALDPGESVTVGGIQLMGRRTPTGLVVAVWADPPAALSIPVDTDGDGMSDVDESVAGTRATDPHSVFRIRLGGPEGHSVQWDSQSNRLYKVLISTDLRQGFVTAIDNIEGSGMPTTFTAASQEFGNGTSGSVFFRVEVRMK